MWLVVVLLLLLPELREERLVDVREALDEGLVFVVRLEKRLPLRLLVRDESPELSDALLRPVALSRECGELGWVERLRKELGSEGARALARAKLERARPGAAVYGHLVLLLLLVVKFVEDLACKGVNPEFVFSIQSTGTAKQPST